MRCPDDAALWAHANDELGLAKGDAVEAHLAACEACREQLVIVRRSRTVVEVARSARAPQVDWRRADDRVMTAAMAHVARRMQWKLPAGFALAAAATAVIAVAIAWAPRRTETPPTPTPELPRLALSIEAAEAAEVVLLSAEEPLAAGDAIREGAVLRTKEAGSAIVRLPDESRARVEPKSRATFARATPEEIEIRLASGSVTVDAAHVARKAFVVQAGAVQVRVVGTAFRVDREGEDVTVAVARGRVEVNAPNALPRFVDAGRTLSVHSTARPAERAIGADEAKAFAPLGIEVAVASPRASAAVPTPKPERASPAPSVASRSEKAAPERPSPPPAATPDQVEAEPESAEPVPLAVVEAEPPPPRADAEHAPEAVESADTLDSPEDEWDMPEFSSAAPPPGAANAFAPDVPPQSPPPPMTPEQQFLRRAEEALKSGVCGRYLFGLVEVIEHSHDPRARERARTLRTECARKLGYPR